MRAGVSMQVLIENYTVRAEMSNFTSLSNGHKHLFKHVIPLFEHYDNQRTEGWEEVIPDPPLPVSVERRRRRAVERLEKVDTCPINQERVVTATCEACGKMTAQKQVQMVFGTEMAAYVAAADQVFGWALSNRNPDGSPLAIAWRDPERGLTFRAANPEGIQVIAWLDESGLELKLITCYREKRDIHIKKKRNFKAIAIELTMERAASKKNGTYRELKVGGAS